MRDIIAYIGIVNPFKMVYYNEHTFPKGSKIKGILKMGGGYIHGIHAARRSG
jgi:hypothetical protein